jgi:hypothetical protein
MSGGVRRVVRRALVPVLAFSVLLALLAIVRPCAAGYRHRVVLFEPASDTRNPEIHARLRGELAAAGFDVVLRPVPPGAELRAAADSVAGELHPAAVIYVIEPPVVGDEVPPIQVWISDRLLRRTFVLSFRSDPEAPGDEAAKVAVQAVEILKADLAELSVTREKRVEPAPAPPPRPRPPAPVVRALTPARLELHAGVGLLQGFSGVGSTWTPFLRAGASLPERWLGGAPLTLSLLGSFAAFGGNVRLDAPEGEAHVRQKLAELMFVARLAPREVVQPFFSLSGGAYAADVRGAGSALVRARQTWSGTSGAGVGAWFEASQSFAFVLSAEVSLAWARTIVRIAERPVATAGAPLVLAGAGIAGVL